MGEMRNAHKILFEKPEEKRPLRRPMYRWEDKIRMNLREIGWLSIGTSGGLCIHCNEPLGSIKHREFLD
jgi:hypothetical protein